MNDQFLNPARSLAVWACLTVFATGQAVASGTIGEHVNNMSAHLDEYSEEVVWLNGKVDGIVNTYQAEGAKAAKPEAVVDLWEAVEFHSAIEINYVPLYSSIWQGLFGVRTAIEQGKPVSEVQQQQALLEQALWQALGAVKLAAQYQERGLLPEVATTAADTPAETVDVIKQHLDRVVAKYAEQLGDEAIRITQETYLNLFEGIEGDLIALDAELVAALEKDFNVTLQVAIKEGKPVDDVRDIVEAMQRQLDKCKALLKEADKNRSDVF